MNPYFKKKKKTHVTTVMTSSDSTVSSQSTNPFPAIRSSSVPMAALAFQTYSYKLE